jgi:Helix-turn-helix.
MGYYSDQEQRSIIADNLTRFYFPFSKKTKKDVAIDLDINPPTFNQWVNGKAIPNISTLRKVAELL